MDQLERKLFATSEEISQELIELRREIHKNPELELDCYETSKLLLEKLKGLNLDIKHGIANTGITALLKGKKKKPVLAIRADIDALPIEEETGLPFASQNKGKMHACGHDGHATLVYGAAKILSEHRDLLEGSIKFIFQPGEEYPGGAKIMIEEGVLENPKVDALISGHIFPGIKNGKIGIRYGALTARNDEFTIDIMGEGGHGAHPDSTQDTIVTSSLFIVELQTIVSRITDPVKPLVINVGEISGGGGHNVVPKKITLKGTIRSIDKKTRDIAIEKIEKLLEGLKMSYNIKYNFELVPGEPPLYCDENLTKNTENILMKILQDKDLVKIDEPSLGSDDCAFFSERIPVVYIRYGSFDEKKGYTNDLHTPSFDFDENLLLKTSKILSYLSINLLKKI
ncbi:MAG TPA: M20 family metallopeptidase [Halanaerobiales bacterium]|nr:M20 family metallopeptidase [Halanaerobiales bacterium]